MGDIFKMENRNPLQELNTTNERATPVVQNIAGGAFEGGMKVLNHMVDTKAKEVIDGKNKLYQEALQEEKTLKEEYETLQTIDLTLEMDKQLNNWKVGRTKETFNNYEEAEKNILKVSEGIHQSLDNTMLSNSTKARMKAQWQGQIDDLLKVEKINTINYGKEVYLSNLQDTLYNSKQKAYEASNSGDPIMMKQ
ncbi:MAG: hypothetical protein ACRC6E_07555, partial [Fusobacteriaceae bacterium]